MPHNIKTDELLMRYLNKPRRMLFSLAQQKKLEKRFATDDQGRIMVDYKGRKLVFDRTSFKYELFEQFIEEQYKKLDVKGKTVIDIGAGTGDTAIFFMLNGAKKVYAFEPSKGRYDAAMENVSANKIEGIELIQKAAASLDDIVSEREDLVLKVDCEGCEHGIFAGSKPESIKRFGQVMLEFHDGYLDVKKVLEQNGFAVEYEFSDYYTADYNGMMYAKRK
jgi:SAM-dependent methyltransferase